MPTAYSVLPDRFGDDRHGIIEAGLETAGWRVERGFGNPGSPADVLITWTVHRGLKESNARAFEAAGGRVLVCEEAYFRRVNGEKHFAIALSDHNGAGRWYVGGPERWASFGIEVKPWRKYGHHILVREQRGIGSAKMASPPGWHDDVMARLRAMTDRPLVFRAHPKSRAYPDKAVRQPPLEQALQGAHAVVTWASSIAGHALVAGVPVFYEAPHIVCEGACKRGLADIESPATGDRLPALERLAWAQWSISEIERGRPFRHLLER
ncbi:MAG: hypothetical protein ACE5KF_01145 [Kiloniellaceae bacterium]